MQEKRCSKCGELKPITEFGKQKVGKYGVRGSCKLCNSKKNKKYYQENKEQRSEYHKKWRDENKELLKEKKRKYREENKENIKIKMKKYREENKDKIKERSKKYYEENKEKIKEHNKKWRDENKEFVKEQSKKWRDENKDKIKERNKKYRELNKDNVREFNKEYCRERRKNDFGFKIKQNIHSRFYIGFRNQQLKKSNSFFRYTGIKYSEYIEHLKNDPLWDDFCEGENIHIDHIIPCAVYDFTNKEHIKKCWNTDNLRLLDGIENMSKNDTLDFDLIEEYDIFHLLP